jgi:hypothetical protein
MSRSKRQVRFVPQPAVSNRSKLSFYSITLSVRASSVGRASMPSVLAVWTSTSSPETRLSRQMYAPSDV